MKYCFFARTIARIAHLFIISCGFLLYSACPQAYTPDVCLGQTKNTQVQSEPASLLFNNDGSPTESFRKVLELTGIKHDNCFATILAETQKHWLRPAGKERWEIVDVHAPLLPELMPLFKQLGWVGEVRAREKSYDYAVVFGALLGRMKLRLEFLVSEWDRGVRFKHIVLLSGFRQLIDEEKKEIKTSLSDYEENIPNTEAELFWYLYTRMYMPDAMRRVPVIWINAPAKPGAMRATTLETTQGFLRSVTRPGSILAISSQPYIGYQDLMLRTSLTDAWHDVHIETIGPVADTIVGVYLDNCARMIYQYKQLKDIIDKRDKHD